MSSNATSRPRRRVPVIIASAVAVVVVAGAAIGGTVFVRNLNRVDQVPKADCELAQKIISEAHGLKGTPAQLNAWQKKTRADRLAHMDGYLGYVIAQYELWSVAKAKGQPLPEKADVAELSERANEFCSDAEVTLQFPSLAA